MVVRESIKDPVVLTLEEAIKIGNLQQVKCLLKKGEKAKPFDMVQAAKHGHTEIVNLFIKEGVDATAYKNNAIWSAIENNQKETVQLLFEKLQKKLTEEEKYRMLLYVAEEGELKILKILLKPHDYSEKELKSAISVVRHRNDRNEALGILQKEIETVKTKNHNWFTKKINKIWVKNLAQILFIFSIYKNKFNKKFRTYHLFLYMTEN